MHTPPSGLIEPELREPAPRPTSMTSAGVRTFALSTAPVAAALALAALLFFSRQQPVWLAALFVVFFLCGAAILYRVVLLWLARVQLVREGLPVSATVVEKEESRRGAARYYCWYQADSKQWGLGWTGDRDDAEIGDAVTVLYSPEDPSRALAYRWAGCVAAVQAEPAGAGRD